MANIVSGGPKVFTTPWDTQIRIELPAAIPATTTTFYDGQAVGRNSVGNMVQMDDTAKCEFLGILRSIKTEQVASTDSAVVNNGVPGALEHNFRIERPLLFTAQVASAGVGGTAGMEGKKVFWLYNNEVQIRSDNLTSANYAGTILQVKDSTHVVVMAPWCRGYTQGGVAGVLTGAAAATTTLTKWDANKLVVLPLTSSGNVVFPAANTFSPGDELLFINTSANSSVPTFVPAGADNINGANSNFTGSAAQYSMITFRSDGNTNWYTSVGGEGPLTVGGNLSVTGTITGTSASASAFAVGRLGATTPAFVIDASAATSVTGLKISSKASAGGLAVVLVGGNGNESMTLDATGTGKITLNATATGTVQIGSSLTVSAVNIVTDTTTGTQIGTATGQKLGFFGVTPVVQVAAIATTTTASAGGTTSVFVNTTFNGNNGTAAYTVNGVVTALKALGLLAT